LTSSTAAPFPSPLLPQQPPRDSSQPLGTASTSRFRYDTWHANWTMSELLAHFKINPFIRKMNSGEEWHHSVAMRNPAFPAVPASRCVCRVVQDDKMRRCRCRSFFLALAQTSLDCPWRGSNKLWMMVM
jgi:hypothetical protein